MAVIAHHDLIISYADTGVLPGGPPAVFVHSSAASSRQWTPAFRLLASARRCLAPDLVGYGQTRLTGAARFDAGAELRVLEGLAAVADEPFHLVGHSYGGAAALAFALAHPTRILSLTLIEPTLFAWLRESGSTTWDEIENLAANHIRLVEAGMCEAAASRFIGYWAGPTAFAFMPRPVRETIIGLMPKVAQEWRELLRQGGKPEGLETIRAPVLLLEGASTTLAARSVMRLLRGALPEAQHELIPGAGHLSPITHPEDTAARIAGFLAAVDGAAARAARRQHQLS